MQYLALGKSGIEASTVGLGAWAMGGGAVWGDATDDADAIRTIHAALDAGVNLVDTAPCYGFGHGEEVVGKALKGRRDRVVLATKCGLVWDEACGSLHAHFDGKDVYRLLEPASIRAEIERSLRRLQTDYIDLYQPHWPAIPPLKTPIADTMGALMDLKREGKIRAIGVCNVSAEELREFAAHGDLATDQFRYSMLHREPEEAVLPCCKELGIATLTYMTLEQGLLTGKVDMDTVYKPGEFRNNSDWNPWYVPKNRARLLVLLDGWKPLCSEYGCTLAQLVLAWSLAQDGITHVLAGARHPGQILDTAAAADLQLDPEDIRRMCHQLEALGAPQPA